MRKLGSASLIALLLFVMVAGTGCMAHSHVIGNGGSGDEMVEKRQWYVLWGLVPIKEVDTAEMSDGASNYTIETERSVLDVIINIFTGIVTVHSRTIVVTK